jgi:hypothetical protein
MAVEIVSEIVTATKALLATLLPDFTPLRYEYDISKNNEKGLTKSFGFIPKSASFKDGSALSFTTMEHNFQLILTTDYFNKDCDDAQANAVQDLYAKAHGTLKELQKKSIALPTSGYTVLLISGIDFEDPEHFDDNSSTVLRVNFLITYRFRNN